MSLLEQARNTSKRPFEKILLTISMEMKDLNAGLAYINSDKSFNLKSIPPEDENEYEDFTIRDQNGKDVITFSARGTFEFNICYQGPAGESCLTFTDPEQVLHQLRMAVLSKLSDEERRKLGDYRPDGTTTTLSSDRNTTHRLFTT